MAKKKKRSEAAENLIESLMDDLKDLSSDGSYHHGADDGASSTSESGGFVLASTDYDANADSENVEQSPESKDLWNGLGSEASGDLDDVFEVGYEDQVGESSNEVLSGPPKFEPVDDFELPIVAEEKYDGPSTSDDSYQAPSKFVNIAASSDDPTMALNAFVGGESKEPEDKTFNINSLDSSRAQSAAVASTNFSHAETVAVEGFANAAKKKTKSEPKPKVSVGSSKPLYSGGNVHTSIDASLAQAESLKIAQQRLLEIEKENEMLRAENEELASAGEIIRSRSDAMAVQLNQLEREKREVQENYQSELVILKGNLQFKDTELAAARMKVEDLETRLKSDFKKIRVRERELENRLEIIRAEKAALVQSKDEYILEQKRKIDQLSQELDNYRKKCLELNKQIETNQDQVKRTERALRLALTNLESKEENLVPLKKAE